jgi:hypothetical protein
MRKSPAGQRNDTSRQTRFVVFWWVLYYSRVASDAYAMQVRCSFNKRKPRSTAEQRTTQFDQSRGPAALPPSLGEPRNATCEFWLSRMVSGYGVTCALH